MSELEVSAGTIEYRDTGGDGPVVVLLHGLLMDESLWDAVIADLSKERFDHARTLGMSEWRVVWEVVVLGTADEAFEVLRQNAAIGWMMLTMVEGISRAEGGIGAMLLNQNKHFHLAEVFAIQIVILLVGMGQDYAIGLIRNITCPYATLTLERR